MHKLNDDEFATQEKTFPTSLIFVKQKASSNATSSETILPVANGQTVTTLYYSDLNITSFRLNYSTVW